MAVRLTGALDVAALEAALGDLVARHESLRTVFPETLGVPRQLILDAAAARPQLAVTARQPRRACRGAAGRGGAAGLRSRGRAAAAGASVRARATSEHVLLLLLHHIAGDGWSLAPLARDLARAYAARLHGRGARTCRRCRCSMPTTRCGSTRCWARRAIRQSAIARQLAFWTETLRGAARARSSCRATGRGRRCRAIAATACRLRSSAELHAGLLALARRERASLFMVLQAALAALLTRLGGGHRHPDRQPDRGPHRRARSTTWSGSSSTPWCCAPTRRAIRASASCSRGCGRPTWRPTATRTCRSSGWSRCSTRRARCRGIRCSR